MKETVMDKLAIADQIIQRQDKDGMLRRALERIIQLYTDKSHFVYELLQNAEDAGATKIIFNQYNDRLEVFHNGHPFTRKNLQGLCDIGKSDKINDLNKIGEFGVGFKSVFGICEKVKVYSHPSQDSTDDKYQRFAVEIIDFTHPVDIEDTDFSTDYTTRFVFPYSVGFSFSGFETISKLNEGLSKRLRNLGINTLLFMKSLESIQYTINTAQITGEGTYSLEKIPVNDHCSLITATQEEGKKNQDPAFYILFSRNIAETESDRTIDIAILMRRNKEGKYYFQPAKNPFISVFFPTETESKLKFIVQGPFRTTPNRSSVPADDKDNLKLAEQVAELMRDSFLELRDSNLLDFTLLNLLPIDETAFDNAPLFKCVYDKAVSMLKSDEILYCKDGSYANVDHVKLARGNEFAEVLNEEYLTELINDGKDYHWLPLSITETSKIYKKMYDFLVNQLNVVVIRPEVLKPYFDRNKEFLSNRDDEWLVNLYKIFSAVGAAFSKSKQKGSHSLLTAEFVKTSKGTFVAPYRKAGGNTDETEYIARGYEHSSYIPNVFLPIGITEGMNDINFVDENIYSQCKVFFKDILGLQQPNRYELFVRDYAKRGRNGGSTPEQHISDIQNLLKYRLNEDYADEIKNLTERYLRIRCCSDTSIEYLNPLENEVFLPETKDGLSIKIYFKNVKKYYFVDTDFYGQYHISRDQFIALGVKESIELHADETTGEYNIRKQGKQPNWKTQGHFRWKLTLMHLNDVLKYISSHPKAPDSMAKSGVIFKYLMLNEYRLCGEIIIGGRTENIKDALSSIINILKKKTADGAIYYTPYAGTMWDGKWLYTASGDLVSPREISRKDLNTALYGPVNPKSRIYDWLEFKKNKEERYEAIDKEYEELSREKRSRFFELELAKRYGLAIADLDENFGGKNAGLNGKPLSYGEELLPEFPVSNIRNWDSLKRHAAEILFFAVPTQYEYVRRHVRVSNTSRSAQTYLKSMYKSEESYRFACQMCHKSQDHIEICQIADNPSEELDPMNICLCPNCASKYRAIRKSKSDIDSFLLSISSLSDNAITSNDYVSIPLSGEQIWFTQTHVAEIRELIELKSMPERSHRDIYSGNNTTSFGRSTSSNKKEQTNLSSKAEKSVDDEYVGRRLYHVPEKSYATVKEFDGTFIKIKYDRGQAMTGDKMFKLKVSLEKGIIRFLD